MSIRIYNFIAYRILGSTLKRVLQHIELSQVIEEDVKTKNALAFSYHHLACSYRFFLRKTKIIFQSRLSLLLYEKYNTLLPFLACVKLF